MGITEWVAVLVIFAVVYCLIKRYETRLVLIGSGLLLCLISWNLVGGLNAFAKSMTNASLVMAICGSMGFAFVAKYTEADRSLRNCSRSTIGLTMTVLMTIPAKPENPNAQHRKLQFQCLTSPILPQ